jgi:hypothetical protein
MLSLTALVELWALLPIASPAVGDEADSSSCWKVARSQRLAAMASHEKDRCLRPLGPAVPSPLPRAGFPHPTGTISGTIVGTIAFV